MRPHWLLTIATLEAVVVLCVLLIAAWQFSGWTSYGAVVDDSTADSMAARLPSFGSSYLVFAVLLAGGAYGLFQLFGRSSLALWAVALLTILPQTPGIWAHNKLEWEKFMGVDTALGGGHPLFLAGALFVTSLLGLVVLHRLIALRKLGGLLTSRRVDAGERDSALASEGMAVAVIVALALVLALVLVGAGTVLGRSAWVASNVPWTVVTIGGSASLLLIGFVALFLRGLSEEAGTEAG